MKNFPKAGLLIVTLVIPALIFVLLRLFTTNHFDLPYFNPRISKGGQIEIANGDTIFQKTAELKLESGSHKLEGDISVISFLPMNCEDTCQLVLSSLKRIYDIRSDQETLTIKTLSEDSLNKSSFYPEEMGKNGWEVWPASDAEISSFLDGQSDFTKNNPELYRSRNGLILIDSKGYTRGYYNGADPEEIDRLMAEVKILNYENKASANP